MRQAPNRPAADALLDWWDRIGIGVRCGYNPHCPCAVRRYLEAGRRVAATGARPEVAVMKRLLTVLLQTARDDALPRYWRQVCVEHATYPLARLTSLLKHHDPIACHALAGAVQAAGDAVANAAPGAGR